MGNTKKQTDSQETRKVSLSSLFDRVLIRLDLELDKLPETLEAVSPEKRLDFISKNLPLLLRYRESGEGNSWVSNWGD